jgi:hypothetical protein
MMPGGLKAVAQEIWQATAREQLGSPAMHRAGRAPGMVYQGEDYLAIFAELNSGRVPPEVEALRNLVCQADRLRDVLQRENAWLADGCFPGGMPASRAETEHREQESRAEILSLKHRLTQASQAPALEMLSQCAKMAAVQIPEVLRGFASDGGPLEVLIYRDLRAAAEANQREFTARADKSLAPTATAKAVTEELEAVAVAQTLGLLQGETREGKTTAAQAFHRKNLHRCRYASLEDDLSDRRFYEILANAVSGPIDARWVKDDFRAAITGALIGSGLMLIIDEAHNLFPRNRKSRPVWLEWVRTALVDRGVAVALISTPQFVGRIHATAQASGWQSDQFTGRIGKLRTIEPLAADNPKVWDERREDIAAVARCHLPGADARGIAYMTETAIVGRTPFHLVATMARDAREAALRRGSPVQLADVRAAAEKASQFTGRISKALQPPKKQRPDAEASGRRREVSLPNPKPIAAAVGLSRSGQGDRGQGVLPVSETAQIGACA